MNPLNSIKTMAVKPIVANLALALGSLMLANTAIAGDAHSGELTNFDNVAWKAVGEGFEEAILWGSEENNDAVWAFRMQPGVEFPLHSHTHDYHGLAIQGTWVHIDDKGNKAAASQDAFAFVKGGEFHGDRCEGPEVCITLIDMDGPRDLFFPK